MELEETGAMEPEERGAVHCKLKETGAGIRGTGTVEPGAGAVEPRRKKSACYSGRAAFDSMSPTDRVELRVPCLPGVPDVRRRCGE